MEINRTKFIKGYKQLQQTKTGRHQQYKNSNKQTHVGKSQARMELSLHEHNNTGLASESCIPKRVSNPCSNLLILTSFSIIQIKILGFVFPLKILVFNYTKCCYYYKCQILPLLFVNSIWIRTRTSELMSLTSLHVLHCG